MTVEYEDKDVETPLDILRDIRAEIEDTDIDESDKYPVDIRDIISRRFW